MTTATHATWAGIERSRRYVGGRVLRKEDARLLAGQATFVDDLTLPGMVWFVVVRSDLAHARINRVDLSRALAVPGVVAAWSGQELASEWAAGLPCAWPVTDDIKMPTHWPLAKDVVRFAGDGVAVVVAESRTLAEDAAEAVDVEYEALPVVLNVEAALSAEAPLVHDDLGTNRCYTWTVGNGEIDRAFKTAPVTLKERYYHPRLVPNAIEPRGVLVQPLPAQGQFTLWSTTQIPHIIKLSLAGVVGIPEAKLRVIAPDVGGGFGSKLNVYAEDALALAIARRLSRPVKWTENRCEAFLATTHGRDVVQDIEVAADASGRLLGVRARLLADLGAYLQLTTPGAPLLGALLYQGAYEVGAYRFECTGAFTNKTPTDSYRGVGRAEATFAIERAIDALARRLGKDPADVRRLNFMPPFDKPTPVVTGLAYDSGNYHRSLERALELAGYDELRKEQRAARGPKLLGIGISSYVEMCGLAPSQALGAVRFGSGGWEAAQLRVLPTGKVVVVTGTSPHGQGHATVWSQIAADRLGVALEDVEVLHGDTSVSALGMGTYGSRSLAVGGSALWKAADKVIDKARAIAAHLLEASEEDLLYKAGVFSVKSAPSRKVTIPEVAFAAWQAHNLPPGMEPGLEASHVFDPPNFTFPAGTHVCVVEVDTETGRVEIRSYVAVDDCGNVVNPMIVDGQLHGGIAQGIGAALFEEAAYDENGNLVTGSMRTYLVPSAVEIPLLTLERTTTPSSTNPMGVKGVGESGTIASPPAVMNAVIDALAPLGVTHIDMPASPERVWRAIHGAKGAQR